jgi:uncharacterized protein (DUF885 family)
MPTPFEISDRFTDSYADLDPVTATMTGIAGRDHLPTDYSPEGHGARHDLYVATRTELARHLDDPDPTQLMAARVLSGWIDGRLAEDDVSKWSWDLNHTASPFQTMRDVLDVMPRETPDDWEAVAARLEALPGMLDGFLRSLEVGLQEGDTVARRQVEAVLEQADAAAGDGSRFGAYPDAAGKAGFDPARVGDAVDAIKAAYGEFGAWLRAEYLPKARAEDGVGLERYLLGANDFLGMSLDPRETYDWGWSEVHRLMGEMERTASEVDPSLGLADVIELLETDPARSAATREDFVEFVQACQQDAIAKLDGVHFDVPEPLRTVTVNIAPPGGALGAWYVGPTEDGSRPGSIWYAPGERERLPYWQEVSTAYHEGFPGHHLQGGTALLLRDRLSRAQRMLIWYSGAGEGWALYAERLMDELGFFEKPEYRLGLLASQLFRAARVVVDIGCGLSLRIPDDAPLHAGEVWGYDAAVDYMVEIGLTPHDMAVSEVTRYLGWAGQAISYKVGEREILAIRDRARRSAGAGFDLKEFHRRLLEAGAIRLDHLHEVMG